MLLSVGYFDSGIDGTPLLWPQPFRLSRLLQPPPETLCFRWWGISWFSPCYSCRNTCSEAAADECSVGAEEVLIGKKEKRAMYAAIDTFVYKDMNGSGSSLPPVAWLPSRFQIKSTADQFQFFQHYQEVRFATWTTMENNYAPGACRWSVAYGISRSSYLPCQK